jgi:hypothetical protein
LKKGQSVTIEELTVWYTGAVNSDIPKKYWDFIMTELMSSGYVKGFEVKEFAGGNEYTGVISITPVGIEFLFDNKTMQKIEKDLPTSDFLN